MGLALLGVGVMVWFAPLERADRRRRELEERREAASRDPQAVVDRYAAALLSEARRSGTPPRQLGQTALASAARRVGDLTAEPGGGFERSGAMTIAVQTSSLLGNPYCLVLPEAPDGQPSITSGTCRVPLDEQRSEVEVVVTAVMERARARGLSPRDPTLLAEFADRPQRGRSATAHPTGLQVQLTLNPPFGDTVWWCVDFPETVDGTPKVTPGFCPSRK